MTRTLTYLYPNSNNDLAAIVPELWPIAPIANDDPNPHPPVAQALAGRMIATIAAGLFHTLACTLGGGVAF